MKLLLRLCAFALIFTLAFSYSHADFSTMTFEQESGTYTELSDGDMLSGSGTADDDSWSVNIGFNFTFNGSTYSSVNVNSNGFIHFEANGGSDYVSNMFSDGDISNAIAGMNHDLRAYSSSAGIYTDVLGSSPNRIFVVEWNTYSSYGDSGEEINFQIRLYEASGNVEIVYGDCSFEDDHDARVGLKGSDSPLEYSNREVTEGDNTWATSVAGDSEYDACEITSDFGPAEGLTYSWNNPPMEYLENETIGFDNSIPQGGSDQAVIVFNIVTEGATSPLSATEFTFNTNGTDDVADLTSAKLYFTGGNGQFSTDEQFGDAISNPDGELTFTDDMDLVSGNNYFWLAYDIASDATLGNLADGEAVNVSIYSPADDETTIYNATDGAPEGGREIKAPLAGTYYIGEGEADYPNLAAIFQDANILGLSDDVTCEIVSDITEETGATLVEWGEVGDGDYSWTITHDGTPRTITLENLLIFDGADNVTIDGSEGDDNYLTINNTAGYSGVLFISNSAYDPTDDESEDDGLGANDNTVMNCNINVTPNSEIGAAGVGFLGTANNNSVVKYCDITGATFGVVHESGEDLEIMGNNIGSDDPDMYIQVNGIVALYSTGDSYIRNNHIFNIVQTYNNSDGLAGIRTFGSEGAVFAHNKIENIINNTWWGSRGISVEGGSTNKFVNNEVLLINSDGRYTTSTDNPVGIYVNGASNNKFLQNSVYLYGEFGSYSEMTACFMVDDDAVSSLDVRNNIFVNKMENDGEVGSYAIYAYPGNFGTLNYNNYFSDGDIAYDADASAATDLYGWQNATDMDANSSNVDVTFLADDDLHLDGASVGAEALRCPVVNQGNNEWYADIDMDGETRTDDNNMMGVDIAVPTLEINPELTRDAEYYCPGDEMFFSFGLEVVGFGDEVERMDYDVYNFAGSYTWYENGQEIVIQTVDEEGNPMDPNYDINQNELTVYSAATYMENFNCEVSLLGAEASTATIHSGVEIPLVINQQPVTQEVCVEDEDVVIRVDAGGTIIDYQWQMMVDGEWMDVEGANGAEYRPYLPYGTQTTSYRVLINGPGNCGPDQLISDPMDLIIYYPLTDPYLIYDFNPADACFGDDLEITCNVDGTIYGYQWQKIEAGAWSDIDPSDNPTAIGRTLRIEDANPSHSGTYRCMVYGSAVCETAIKYSEELELTVYPLFEILRQPEPQVVVCYGDTIRVDVVIDGRLVEDDEYIPAYQWYKDGRKIDPEVNPTANDPMFMIPEAEYKNSGAYSVEIYKQDCRGKSLIMSTNSIVYVLAEPEITKAPMSKTAEPGDNLHFEVKAHVEGAPTDYMIFVQWFKGVKPGIPMTDGEYVEGAQASYLNIKDVQPSDYSEYYYVEVTGKCGTAQSDYFSISEAPVIDILTHPADVSACPTTTATFSVEAEVSTVGPMMEYQWRFNGDDLTDDANVSGANTSELTLTGVTESWEGTYDCVITLDTGGDTKTSNGAELTIKELPVIIADPTATVDLQVDDMLELAVVANGDDLMYQWYKDDAEIDGATGSTFTIDAVTVDDAGTYKAKVYNECAEVMSEESVVTVTLLNWSSVDNPVAGGFTLLGNSPNPFNGSTNINFTASEADDVRLVITDIYGREVAELIDGTVAAGNHTVEFNADEYELGSGMYFYSLISDGYTATKRMVIVK